MTLETSYEHFELLADAPNAVPKLREMVLQLAVRGNLVEQNQDDESAQELLTKIAEARANAESSARRRKRANYESASLKYELELPRTWTTISLGEVTDIIRGITFPSLEKGRQPEAGTIACLRTTNVQAEVEWHDLLYVPEHRVKNASQVIQPHDILISMANSYELVGKVAQVKNIPVQATFGGFIAAIRPIIIEPTYLLYFLRSPESQAEMRASSSQTTNIANISLGRLNPMAMPLPPLEEQKRIVAKVDELMALCDDLEQKQKARAEGRSRLNTAVLTGLSSAPDERSFKRAWERVGSAFNMLYSTPETISDLRKTILQLAVQGKLVRQDPNDEPVTVLSDNLDAKTIPINWTATRLGDCVELISGQHLKPDEYNDSGNGIPYLTGPADFGKLEPVASRWSVVRRAVALKGDILLTVKGAGIGKTNKLGYDEAAISRQLMAIRPLLLTGDFVHIYLQTIAESFQGMRTGIAIPGIGRSDVLDHPVHLPPLAEQKCIVAKVDELMALLDELEARLLQARGDSERLLEGVIQNLLSAESKQPVEV